MPNNSYVCDSIMDATGRTPLVALKDLGADSGVHAYAKLESFNPGGSAKDRTAAAMVEDARQAGLLGPGAVAVESSSGNLGVALARQAVVGGWDFHCVVDPRVNEATATYMRALGTTVHMVTEPDPETGDWLIARRTRVAELIEELGGAVNFDQYSNQAAFRAHEQGTMAEIVDTLDAAPDYLFVAVSTTGTLGGCQRYLASHGMDTTVVAVDAAGSVLFGGERGERVLPGYGAGVPTELSRAVHPDEVVRVEALDAIIGARRLARTEAILPGASGGAVVAAFEQFAPRMSPGETAVLIFHDDGRPYLDTVYSDEWVCATLGVELPHLNERIMQ